jgi:phosphoadenosine phosphosulfate reductase
MFVDPDHKEPIPASLPRSGFDAAALNAELAQASPREIVETAIRTMPGRMAVVSSFGTESAVLLKFVAEVDRSLPVLFLDTQWLFKETLAYRDALIARLGLTDVRTVLPSPSALAMRDPKRDLAFRDRDACCEIRKVAPLAAELAGFDGWMSGRKRYHGGERAALPVVEDDGPRLKFNPLARLSRPELNAVFAAAKLPRHPLESIGFTSVGCVPCTHKPADGDVRGGRWSGLSKTECGIHLGPLPAAQADR